VHVVDNIAKTTYIHEPNWTTSDPKEFLDEILSGIPGRQSILKVHEKLLSTVETPSGECVGRAALRMYTEERAYDSSAVSVGGFVYSGEASFEYVGVLEGETDDVRRGYGTSKVAADNIAKWATKQAQLIDKNRFQIYDLMKACHPILQLGGDSLALPFCFCGGKFTSVTEFDATLSKVTIIRVPLNKTYDDNFEFQQLSELSTTFFAHRTIPELVVMRLGRTSHFFSKERGREIIEQNQNDVSLEELTEQALGVEGRLLLARLNRIWGTKPSIRVELIQLFQEELYRLPSVKWAMSFFKP